MVRLFIPGKNSPRRPNLASIRTRSWAWGGGLLCMGTVVTMLAASGRDAPQAQPRGVLAALGMPLPEMPGGGKPFRRTPDFAPRPGDTPGSLALRSLGLPRSEAPKAVRAPRPPARRKVPGGHLSPYDEILRAESAALGVDWRLIAALMYEESQFDPRAMNRSGARGLMQVMPASAGVDPESLFDPLTNIRAGLRIFNDSYQGFAELDSLDRLQFTIAAYNAGLGRINDARRVASELGLDTRRWQGAVADAFLHLADPQWKHLVRHGRYPGRGTVTFVDETLARYRRYAQRVDHAGDTAPLTDLAATDDPLP